MGSQISFGSDSLNRMVSAFNVHHKSQLAMNATVLSNSDGARLELDAEVTDYKKCATMRNRSMTTNHMENEKETVVSTLLFCFNVAVWIGFDASLFDGSIRCAFIFVVCSLTAMIASVLVALSNILCAIAHRRILWKMGDRATENAVFIFKEHINGLRAYQSSWSLFRSSVLSPL